MMDNKLNIKYSIECFKKKGNSLEKIIYLNKKNINYRILLNKWKKKEILDNIKINKMLKVKLQSRNHIGIPLVKYDCFFCETID